MPTINGVDYTDAQIAAFCAQDLDCPKFDVDFVNLFAYLRNRACHQSIETEVIRVPVVTSDARSETVVVTETYDRKFANSCLLILADISHVMQIDNPPSPGTENDVKGESRVLIRFDGGGYSTAVKNHINTLYAPGTVNGDTFRTSTSGNFSQKICGTEAQVTIDLAMIFDRAAIGFGADETQYTEGSGLYSHSIGTPSSITIIETETVA